jgi:hypothetical protein
MHTTNLPLRKALLIDARILPMSGLKDGLYLVTPEQSVYDAIFLKCASDYLLNGIPMPYATPVAGSLGAISGPKFSIRRAG